MQAVYKKKLDYPGKSETIPLPMIDLDPNDLSCIYSTLKFVTGQARKNNCAAILTFDQPLFWKASSIVDSETEDSDIQAVILKIGGLHLEMSFLGSIGHLMAGTGLSDLLGCVYAENSVPYLLSGKAISRAIRGHTLASAALNTMLMSSALNIPLRNVEQIKHACLTGLETKDNTENESIIEEHIDTESSNEGDDVLTKFDRIFEELINSDKPPNFANIDNDLLMIRDKYFHLRSTLTDRTSILWLMYLDMVDILLSFIKSERTGDWSLHLQSTRAMLPFLAASGRFLYVKMYLYTFKKWKS